MKGLRTKSQVFRRVLAGAGSGLGTECRRQREQGKRGESEQSPGHEYLAAFYERRPGEVRPSGLIPTGRPRPDTLANRVRR